MYNLLEYGLGKMLIGIGTFGDYLADFTFDTLEEEPKLEYNEFENHFNEENELKPYKEKIKYLTKFDKYFSHEVKSKGIKYYILDKIKSYNFNDNIISGIIHENNIRFFP